VTPSWHSPPQRSETRGQSENDSRYSLVVADGDDSYAKTAPFYDVLASSLWASLAPALAAALVGVDPTAGPVIDLGAGTGRSTMVIADSVSNAEVWAVEPSPSMRAILLGHLGWRADLWNRVSVVAGDAIGFGWPARVAAVVACNMIGHLDVAERAVLWERVAATVADGGLAVVGLQPPSRPERLEPTEMATVEVGQHRYVGLVQAHPTGPRSMRWTMTYRKSAGTAMLEDMVNTFDWWTVGIDDIRDEVSGAGLAAEPAEQGLVVIRKSARRTERQ
jgi:SAM-dependent methyltransferase